MSSCKADSPPPDCGCGSETRDTVPSDRLPHVPIEEQTSGLIFYKRAKNIDFFDNIHNGRYNDTYWIFKGIGTNYIICNEELLGSEYDFLKTNDDSIPIIFRGDLKFLCVDPFVVPTKYNYSEIKLTSIEKP